MHLGALAVPRDACGPGVHDVPDAGHGQGGLGDVRGKDHATTGVLAEDTVLLGGRQTPEERQDLGVGQGHAVQRLCGVPDLTLPGEEHEDVSARVAVLGPQLLDGLADAGDLVNVDTAVIVQLCQRSVAHLDRIGAPGHLDDGRVIEMPRESLRVNGCRRDDDLEIRPARQQLLEVTDDEVDVETAFVGLVDDDRVVSAQVAVTLHLGEQDAVCHDLDQGVGAGVIGEAHLISDGGPELGVQLFGDALRHGPGGDASRLGVADHALDAAAELEADLGQLCGLAGAGLSRHDDDLVVADGRGDIGLASRDRQVLGVGDLGHRRETKGDTGRPSIW